MLGLFDSGVGGLTVVRELLRRSPQASFLYLGDTARTPYGNKSPDVLRHFAVEDARFLIERGATDIVVACNTVSSVAMDALREAFPSIRFFDVITPAVAVAVERKDDVVGVIGTRATISSGLYETRLQEAAKAKGQKIEVVSAACPLFVPLVEEHWTDRAETKRIARTYLQPLRQKQVDALILGCTHYPMLEDVIKASLQKRVHIIDSPSCVLDEVKKVAPELLEANDRPTQKLFFTDLAPQTIQIVRRWIGPSITPEKVSL